MPDELVVAFVEDLAKPGSGPTPEAAFEAAGVTPIGPPETGSTFRVRLNSGTSYGTAFQTLQSFEFPADRRWRLRYVQPNYLYFTIPPPSLGPRVFNFSTRADVRTGDAVVIGGLVVPGDYPRLVVVKVRGASLTAFNITAPLGNPRIQLFRGSQPILHNDDWGTLRDWEKSMALALCPPPDDPLESMIVTYLDPGAYTAVVSGEAGTTGVALFEFYVLDHLYALNPSVQ